MDMLLSSSPCRPRGITMLITFTGAGLISVTFSINRARNRNSVGLEFQPLIDEKVTEVTGYYDDNL